MKQLEPWLGWAAPNGEKGEKRARATDHGVGGHHNVLDAIPIEYRQSVLSQCVHRRYRKGQVLWRQGDPADSVVFLVEGKTMSCYNTPSGKTGVTGFWFAGDILGCGDLGVPSRKRQMTVRVLLDGTITYSLPMEKFYELTRRFPEVSHTIIKALSIRLGWVARLAIILQTQNALERLASVLLEMGEGFGKPSGDALIIDLCLTQEDLAAMVGVSRQFATTTLHALEKKGLVALEQRKIVLTDLPNLRKVAGNYI